MTDGIEREIEDLRAENARLRERNERLEHDDGRTVRPARWRRPIAVVLMVLGGLLLAAAVPAVWAARTVLNTERYTETVAPLATDPAIRTSVANTAVGRLFEQADVEQRLNDSLPPRAAFAAPAIASQLRDVSVSTAERALASPRFETLWTEANRRAHQRIVPALLTGTAGPRGNVSLQDGTVTVDMTAIVAQVKQALVDRGIGVVANVPDTVAGGDVVLLRSPALAQAATALRTLQTLSIALPALALLSLVAAVAVSPDRRRALLWVGATAIVAMLALGVALALLRDAYVASPPLGVLSGAAAVSFFDTLVRFLRNALRTVAALGLLLLIGAALAGPSRAAVGLRGAVGNGVAATGLDLGRASFWTDRHRRALDVVLIVIAGAVLLATNTPTPGLVIGLGIALLIAVLVVELVARAHPPTPFRGQPAG